MSRKRWSTRTSDRRSPPSCGIRGSEGWKNAFTGPERWSRTRRIAVGVRAGGFRTPSRRVRIARQCLSQARSRVPQPTTLPEEPTNLGSGYPETWVRVPKNLGPGTQELGFGTQKLGFGYPTLMPSQNRARPRMSRFWTRKAESSSRHPFPSLSQARPPGSCVTEQSTGPFARVSRALAPGLRTCF